MNLTVFITDGFNLYHSLAQIQGDTHGQSAKWLDLKSLCLSYLPVVGRLAGERATFQRIYYYSAPPTHRSDDKQQRHTLYMRCLRENGVNVQLARFKRKEVWCPNCRQPFTAHEEKETDVAIAARLFEVCHSNEAEAVILVTGDTDLAPAVRTCKRLFPTKLIIFAFPYKRTNSELGEICPESFSIKRRSCLRYQFPDPFILPNGTTLTKPTNW